MEELKIKNEIIEGKYEVKDFDNIKSQLQESLKKYDLPEVNEDNYKFAKDSRTTLNKLSKAVDDKRKEAQKKYMESFNIGADQIKELVNMINVVSSHLGDGVVSIDNRYRNGKRSELKQYFNSSHTSIITFEQIEDPKWYNKSTKIEDAEKAIDEKLTNINKDIYILSSSVSKEELPVALYFYYRSLDLNVSLRNFADFKNAVEKIKETLK